MDSVFCASSVANQLRVRLFDDLDRELFDRTNFLVDVLLSAGVENLVLGVSGGQDSALAAVLCSRAVDVVRQRGGVANFVAVRLPYKVQSDAEDVDVVLDFVKPDRVVEFNIAEGVDCVVSSLVSVSGSCSDFNKGNVKARLRMVFQYALAGEIGGLVVGTDHAAEAVTGFFTKFGDGAADVMPLYGLLKRQGADLLRFVDAPEFLWLKTPTADLLDSVPGRADVDELGVSYQVLDDFLSGFNISESDFERIRFLFERSEHKRRGAFLYGD